MIIVINEVDRDLCIEFSGNLDNPGKSNINLIEINVNGAVQYDENKNHIKEEKSDLDLNSLNKEDQIQSQFNKLAIPRYKIETEQIDWSLRIFDSDSIVENKPSTDFYLCEICQNIIISPKKCSECEKLFCGKCIESWLLKNNENKCTRCRKDFELREIGFNEKCLLNNMIVECPFNCGEKFLYEKLEHHLKNCTQIIRKYTCELCQMSIDLKNENLNELSNHNENCLGILYECFNCFKKFYKDSLEDHENLCKERLKKCSNCRLNYYEKFSSAHDSFYCEKINFLLNFIISLSRRIQLI